MKYRDVRSRAGRAGYTLIELLVVIAIIGVLVSLLMSAVMAVLQAKDRTGNRYDVGKLDQSMGAALQKYGNSKTLPGQIVLYNNIDKYRNPALYSITNPYELQVGARTKELLRRMFGERFITNATLVSWDGSSNPLNDKPMILEGQQCMVFYLGGMQSSRTAPIRPIGFSANPLDPTAPVSAGGDRIGPFYEFEAPRLLSMPSRTFVTPASSSAPYATTANGATFVAYLDRYGTPFAYFGGTGGANTHISFCPSLGPALTPTPPFSTPNNPEPGTSPPAAPMNLGGPLAYQESATLFAKPSGWQIISAGKDKKFGKGGLTWNPTTGSSDLYAADDVSNFSSSYLNKPQN